MGVDAPERIAVRPDSAGLTGVRLHTRMPVTPAWLARHVVPVARALGEQGAAGVQLRRGWLHGPHVDILALSAPGLPGGGPDWADVARRLDAGPLDPPRALTEEAYLEQAREFGRLEAVQPPYLPLREHGAVEAVAPGDTRSREPRLDRFRTVVLGALNKPLLRTIDGIAHDPGTATVRLAEAFAALADTHYLGPAYGVFSPRSPRRGVPRLGRADQGRQAPVRPAPRRGRAAAEGRRGTAPERRGIARRGGVAHRVRVQLRRAGERRGRGHPHARTARRRHRGGRPHGDGPARSDPRRPAGRAAGQRLPPGRRRVGSGRRPLAVVRRVPAADQPLLRAAAVADRLADAALLHVLRRRRDGGRRPRHVLAGATGRPAARCGRRHHSRPHGSPTM
ncbi:LOW QUALITY PROTEIN: conserved hypothetical protein, partial [Streptomyces pristinaespiralis ATCC 25486]